MPIYEYECESCRIRFERLQHFEDDPVKECPECGGAVRRVLQPVGIIFKGKGFYITDHRQLSSIASPAQKALAAPKESGDTTAPAASATEASKPKSPDSAGRSNGEASEAKAAVPSAQASTTKEATG